MDNEGFYAILLAECYNESKDESKCLSAHFKFKNRDEWELYNDELNNSAIAPFNDWLQKNGYKNWYVNGDIETHEAISFAEAINPYEMPRY